MSERTPSGRVVGHRIPRGMCDSCHSPSVLTRADRFLVGFAPLVDVLMINQQTYWSGHLNILSIESDDAKFQVLG